MSGARLYPMRTGSRFMNRRGVDHHVACWKNRIALFLVIASALWTQRVHSQEPFDGVTLISPLNSTTTQLMSLDGTIENTWQGAGRPASFPYLLPDGSILRPCKDPNGHFFGGGVGGRIQKFNPDGDLVWDYYYSTYEHQQHHDIQPMPNGNVLLIAWERKTYEEAIAAGRESLSDQMWPTVIVEVQPEGATTGNIVWEWHLWDHIVQDVDSAKPNFGSPALHPELIDINYGNPGGADGGGDWIHANAIDYNEQLDQIVFSSRPFSELYIIDHSTTTAEAAGHTGGRSGAGGDILYRWGNPQTYGRGTSSDRYFHVVHGVNWIDPGLPGAGHILAFNNGDRPGSNDHSSVDEIVPARDADGHYLIEPGAPFGPATPAWTYSQEGWYAGPRHCGAFRQPNGNTLITAAQSGYVFEVTPSGTTVWEFDHPANIARAPRYWKADLDTAAAFADCLTGPGATTDTCTTHDLDNDNDIDLADFAKLQITFDQYKGP